jgi:hypothetical protein
MASKKEINKIWEKGSTIRSKNPNLFRRDDLGNEIYKPAYGTQGEKGWEIDHKNPVSKGGSDKAVNKRPLQTLANREKSNKYPHK